MAGDGGSEISILMIGDVVGRPGRRVVAETLPQLREELALDLVIANGENASAGIGITPPIAEELFAAGVDVLTSGNHIWRYKEINAYLETHRRLIRPLNYPPGAAGRGYVMVETARGDRVGVLNLLGRVFMDPVDCPFRAADALLAETVLKRGVDALIVDFHAEATSEKVALGRHLDGRVSAVVGTHTHVPTSDERVLPGGTGFQCDVGMSGPFDSVIGMRVESVLPRFLTQRPQRFKTAEGAGTLCASWMRINRKNGRCNRIEAIRSGADWA